MALNKSVLVDVPEKGVVLRTVSGKTYAYYAVATYRNKKGQPTADRKSIGRIDDGSGKLIPNRNYYEIYLNTSAPQYTGIYSCGLHQVFESVVEKLGVSKQLKQYFPENYTEILTVAQYMLSNGNVMAYLDDYTEEHKTAFGDIMTGQRSSRLFESIRQEDILLFLREWQKQKKSKEFIAYDVTSISSYAKNIPELEWGYNRDKEKLPQLNLGMYYGEESRLPLYYRIYPGSISDKAHLKYMVADNEFINSKRTRFVMDRGFYSEENLQFLTEHGYRFVIALPGHLKYCTELIEKHRDKIANRSEYMLGKGLPYGKSFDINNLGFRMRVHIYYDPDKALQESEALYEFIERQENDLRDMTEPPDRKLKYDRYFYINRTKEGGLGFIRNHKAIDKQLEKCGFFLIAETDFTHTTKEILEIYRRRARIENSFDSFKNHIDMKRLRVRNENTTQGKLFCSFISLIVRSYMNNRISDSEELSNMTMHKVLHELNKVKCLDLNTGKKSTLLNPPTKIQRTICDAMEIDPIV